MTKMNAFQVTGFGGLDKLVFNSVDIPEVGKDEVLVKIQATALNNSDIWMREGGYGTDTSSNSSAGWRREGIQFPKIPGSDIAGEIVQVGSERGKDLLNKKSCPFSFSINWPTWL